MAPASATKVVISTCLSFSSSSSLTSVRALSKDLTTGRVLIRMYLVCKFSLHFEPMIRSKRSRHGDTTYLEHSLGNVGITRFSVP